MRAYDSAQFNSVGEESVEKPFNGAVESGSLAKQVSQLSALHSILSWSIARPVWQRDALRRIVVNGSLGQSDMEELEALLRNGVNAKTASGTSIVAIPLANENIPASSTEVEAISLREISQLKNVNRLLAGQAIKFGDHLTVIYGDNGAGKSGYARVIKRACKSRGAAPTLQTDAFSSSPSAGTRASCEIAITSSSGAQAKIAWLDNGLPDSRLGRIFVFDTATASNYLAADGPCMFTPYGLDVLPKLSTACDALARSVKGSIAALDEQSTKALQVLQGSHKTTKVGAALAKLGPATKKADLQSLAQAGAADKERLAELNVLLTVNPKAKAGATRASRTRVSSFRVAMETRSSLLSPTTISALNIARDRVRTSAAAAEAFSKDWKEADALSGTGGPYWVALWEAAREFSLKSAYVQTEFPNVVEDAACVLCQQNLGEAARARLLRFEEFYKNDLKAQSDKASAEFQKLWASYETISPLKPSFEAIDSDLVLLNEEERKALDAEVIRLDKNLTNLVTAVAASGGVLVGEPSSYSTEVLSDLENSLEARAKTEEGADDPATRAKLQQEKSEIEARQWLATVIKQAEEQVDRFIERDRLVALVKEVSTSAITQKSTELTRQLITDKFCKTFGEELKALGMKTLPVELKSVQGAKGQTSFGLRLSSAVQGLPLRDIASEGEQRCMALALFMAELAAASHKSGLVFDDPVSSLDQNHRYLIAQRLAKEALTRQVVVFTHDAVFVNDLKEGAERIKCDAEFRTIKWGLTTESGMTKPGAVAEGLPWLMKSIPDRIDQLRKVQGLLKENWGSPMPTPEQIESIGKAYNLLRATVERLVEQEVFANVVYRFRSYINLKNLHRVVGFTKGENDRIRALFQRACDITDAHDPAAGNPIQPPTPNELLNDIDELQAVFEYVKKRANANPSP
ncbi:AAA family ATPase [Ralstonia sp. GX3-BWBA]|uniref:AAA family ATPase n=1 Tax=Ralstonia sp. GX3-BWBA TaxID=2219865 RepID=UPI0013A6B50B|nr:AAA family ATPase [Ralstonia sp. GX3-BWBA]